MSLPEKVPVCFLCLFFFSPHWALVRRRTEWKGLLWSAEITQGAVCTTLSKDQSYKGKRGAPGWLRQLPTQFQLRAQQSHISGVRVSHRALCCQTASDPLFPHPLCPSPAHSLALKINNKNFFIKVKKMKSGDRGKKLGIFSLKKRLSSNRTNVA